jgi:hypothetical protein
MNSKHKPEYIRNKLIDLIIATPKQAGEDEIMKVQLLVQWFSMPIESGHDAMGVILAGGEL